MSVCIAIPKFINVPYSTFFPVIYDKLFKTNGVSINEGHSVFILIPSSFFKYDKDLVNPIT